MAMHAVPTPIQADGPTAGPPRELYGFQRTVCACKFCRAPCRHIPGSLDVADLSHLCPAGQDVFTWAEQHLRALIDKPVPTLVPARRANGHCHWLFEKQCAVHAQAPFGCAFFDMHQTDEEVEKRRTATMAARREDAANQGLYYRVWLHLCRQGLTAPAGDRAGLRQEMQKLWRARHSS